MDQSTAEGLNSMGYFIVVLVVAVIVTYIARKVIKSKGWAILVSFAVPLVLFLPSGISASKIIGVLVGVLLGNVYYQSVLKSQEKKSKETKNENNNRIKQ